jgi:hypothetical protein
VSLASSLVTGKGEVKWDSVVAGVRCSVVTSRTRLTEHRRVAKNSTGLVKVRRVGER